jgi:tRNA threonylcarbamoyl adenosine modification protein (Sua5/YciO/YrdC/YwlC family)
VLRLGEPSLAASIMAQVFEVHPANPQPRLIRQAASILRAGGVIAYPTDSSYALGCHIGDAAAARRIRQIRGVDESHLLTLVLRDLSEIGYFAKLDNRQFRIVRQGTPGRYTFVLRATREVPRRLQHPRRSTIGVRVPDHAVAQALLQELSEPILSSTLILPGSSEPLNDAGTINEQVGTKVDLIISAGACTAEPTTIVDLAVEPPVIVRLGAGDPARLGMSGSSAAS